MYSTRTSPRQNVDSAKWMVDANDSSTDCSDDRSNSAFDLGSDVEVHAEIDEEDDDLFFSTHKRSSTVVAEHVLKQLGEDGLGDHYFVNVEIDEEDDDVFFSTFRQPSLSSTPQSELTSQAMISQRACSDSEQKEISDIQPPVKDDEIASNVSLHSIPAVEQNAILLERVSLASVESSAPQSVPTSQAIIAQRACSDNEQREISDIQPPVKDDEIVSNVSLHSIPTAERNASLRGRASLASVESDSGGSQLKFLGDLRGSRTGGVRKHLERKLTQEDTS